MAKAKKRKTKKNVVGALVVRLTADTEKLEAALDRVIEKLEVVASAAEQATEALRTVGGPTAPAGEPTT